MIKRKGRESMLRKAQQRKEKGKTMEKRRKIKIGRNRRRKGSIRKAW